MEQLLYEAVFNLLLLVVDSFLDDIDAFEELLDRGCMPVLSYDQGTYEPKDAHENAKVEVEQGVFVLGSASSIAIAENPYHSHHVKCHYDCHQDANCGFNLAARLKFLTISEY